MYCATIPTGSLPPPSTIVAFGSEDSDGAADSLGYVTASSVACADCVACGAADSVDVELLRPTTIKANTTTATNTAIRTRFDAVELEVEFDTELGTLDPGVLAGRFTTDEL